jgi:tagatose 6-phosphate kinase
MILTITLNPSVDISYQIPRFQIDEANRCYSTLKTAGGKGLNVTRVLHSLKLEVKATGFLGGPNGLFIKRELDHEGISHDFVSIEGDTRNCIAILHDLHQTEVMEAGPIITNEEQITFLNHMADLFKNASVIVASGSLPKGITATFYWDLINLAKRFQKPFLLDTSGEALLNAASALPTMIKPNIHEFEQLVGRQFKSEEDLIKGIKEFPLPIPYIMVTLGEKGSIIKHKDHLFRVIIPKIQAINPVGSGDATVAGFAAGLVSGYRGQKLFLHSTLMGLLNALEMKTGKVNTSLISLYEKEIKAYELT